MPSSTLNLNSASGYIKPNTKRLRAAHALRLLNADMLAEAQMSSGVRCEQGFPDALRDEAAKLYDAAFSSKLGLAIPDRAKRLQVLAQAFHPQHAIVAMLDGQLVGVAGFKSGKGSLTSGMTFEHLNNHLGTPGALRAMLVFLLYNRGLAHSQVLVHGIAVSPTMRGKGVGALLLHELQHFTQQNGYRRLRLYVADTNITARRLYERMGFIATEITRMSYLRWLLGYDAAITMEYRVRR
jgi:ribosomal protein S18 acetylase RimI-like enzyme